MEPTLVATLAVGGFCGKAVWDWLYARRREWESLAMAKRLEILDLQLSEF
jgi:hypothetical protein